MKTINRQEYFALCAYVSTLPKYEGGTLGRMPPPEVLVKYEGAVYYPLYFEMKFKQGKHYDVAVLHDLKTNNIIHAPLEKVKQYAD